MDVKEELTTGNDTDKAAELLRRRQEQEELLAEDERLGKLISDQRLEKGVGEEDEAEAEKKIKEYLMTHNEGKEHNEYLVRGAELRCSCGSHTRKMNLNLCHGVYIKGHPAVHELDCVSGEGNNITCFGICGGEEFEAEEAVVVGEDGKRRRGPKCEPKLVGIWWDSYDGTKIVDNDDKMQDDSGNPIGCNTLTVGSFLVCQHGGIISPVNSGQDRTVEVEDFVDGWLSYREVMGFSDEKNSGNSEEASLEEQSLKTLSVQLQDGKEYRLFDIIKDAVGCYDDSKKELGGDIINGVKKTYMNDLADFIKNGKIGVFDFWKFGLREIKEVFSSRTVDYIIDNVETRFMNNAEKKGLTNEALEYTPREIPNSLVLKLYELFCIDKVSEQQIEANKENNLNVLKVKSNDEADPDKIELEDGSDQAETGSDTEKSVDNSFDLPSEHIEDQGNNKWENVHYGESNMHDAGCEIFAIYNARLSLGEEMDAGELVELISIFETRGAALKGKFGTSPLALYNYLKEKGYDVGATDSFQKEDINAMGEKYDTIIITSYNNQLNLANGIHTINISKGEEGYIAHNNYSRDVNQELVASPAVPTLWDAVLDLPEGKTKPVFIIGINNK